MAKNYYASVKELEDKLAEMLAEKSLLHVMDKNKYPITLTVRQNQADDAQMALYDMSDGSMSSRDSVLRLVFNLDGMEIQTSERFVIDEKFMNKIKNQAKKIHAAYVHAFFAGSVDLLRTGNIATDEDDGEEDDGRFDDFYVDPDKDIDDDEDIDSDEDLDDEEIAEDDFYGDPGDDIDAEDYDEDETTVED